MMMVKDNEELGKLELDMQKKLQIDLIFQSITSSYSQFVVNFHINKLECIVPELVNILVTTEGTLKISRGTVLTVEQIFSSNRKLPEGRRLNP